MNKRIAIEPHLTPIKEFLSDKGYSVESVSFNENWSQQNANYDAYVVTGMNSNFMGMQDTKTKAPVIYAEGLTPDQVYRELQSKLH